MKFTWSPRKAALNQKKHSVGFEEAASVFGDLLAITFPDPDHAAREERWLTFGIAESGRLLVLSHFDSGDTIRIISAREATKHEREIYEEG